MHSAHFGVLHFFKRCGNAVRTPLWCDRGLTGDFVARNLGFGHVARDDVMTKEPLPLAVVLLCNGEDKAIRVLERTYLYIKKATVFFLEEKFFHAQKATICQANNEGDNNGVSCISIWSVSCNNVLKINIEEIKTWVRDGDNFVVDTCFRALEKILDHLVVSFVQRCLNFYLRGKSSLRLKIPVLLGL